MDKKDAREQIDKLNKMMDDLVPNDIVIESKNLKEDQPREYTNFDNILKLSQEQAKENVRNMINFYLTDEMISDNWTIKKVAMDVMLLTDSIYLLETNKYAINQSLYEIDAGTRTAMSFTSLANLQKQNLEILKTVKQHVQMMEHEYAKFANDYLSSKKRESPINTLSGFDDDNDDNVYRGSKSLILSLGELDILENKEVDEYSEYYTDNSQEYTVSDTITEEVDKEGE